MKGYSLETAPGELRAFVWSLTDDIRATFGDNIVAIIVHGSLAMGSYYAPKSDIDILVIANDLDGDQRHAFFYLLRKHHQRRPYVGGLETSVVRAADAREPHHPVPFLVHFSETTTALQEGKNGELPRDEDLVAHLMVSKERGMSLFGPSPEDVIGPVRREDYTASVQADIDAILKDHEILESPVYSVLNLCRWLLMQSSTALVVPSKEEAALWAVEHLPLGMRSTVQEALSAYRSSQPVSANERKTAGRQWDRVSLIEFRDSVRAVISA